MRIDPSIHRQDRRNLLRTAGACGGLWGLGLLGGCATGAATATGEAPIAHSLINTTPENQAATFRHVDRMPRHYTRAIRARPGAASSLPPGDRTLEQLRYRHGGSTHSLQDFIAGNRIAGLMVLKNGAIALEQYAMGNTPDSRWTSFSVAKSLTSTLVGAALHDGLIASLDDPATHYATELKDSAYQDNTIRQLLCMCSGVRWIEEYSSATDNDNVRMGAAWRSGRRDAMLELMRTRPRVAPPGTVYHYSTGDSYVLASVVAGATGSSLSDYLSRKIWIPCGMQADGYWLLDAPDGLELGGICFSATLRDYARLGQFFMTEGRHLPQRVLPPGWRDEAGQPQLAPAGYGRLGPRYPHVGYGYQWWALPPGLAGAGHGRPAFMARGLYGQYIYIHPDENVVAVMWSAWRGSASAVNDAQMAFFSLLASAVQALH